MRRRRNRKIKSKFNLKDFVLKEAKRLQREAALSGKIEPIEKVKAEEVDADGYADSLEKDIDFIKALKIKEARLNRTHRKLVKEMKRLQSRKRLARKRVLKKI